MIFSGSESGKMFRVRSDPDPKHGPLPSKDFEVGYHYTIRRKSALFYPVSGSTQQDASLLYFSQCAGRGSNSIDFPLLGT